jgi:hypothetical protein
MLLFLGTLLESLRTGLFERETDFLRCTGLGLLSRLGEPDTERETLFFLDWATFLGGDLDREWEGDLGLLRLENPPP